MTDATGRKIVIGDRVVYSGKMAANVGVVTKITDKLHATVLTESTYGSKRGAEITLGNGMIQQLYQVVVIESRDVPVKF